MDNWVIYAITNKINGKRYYGQTRNDVHERFVQHLWAAVGGGSQTRFAKAIREHGVENFELSGWLAVGEPQRTDKALDTLERTVIALTHAQTSGYNTTAGGKAGKSTGRPKAKRPTKTEKRTFRLLSDINLKLERIASERGRTVSQILAELVTEFTKQNPPSF
jgi:group I intron endonuclease